MPFPKTVRIKNRVIATWKWCLSFRKRDWELDDYPIGTADQDPDPKYSAPRFIQHRYRAYIIDWVVSGSGNTPAEAMAGLKQNFETTRENRRIEGKIPVRPGTKVPVESASQEKVSSNESLSDDFINRILGLDWAWISDESSLWDFHTEQTNDVLVAKIREVYGVDVSDIKYARLWEIFKRIEPSWASIQARTSQVYSVHESSDADVHHDPER